MVTERSSSGQRILKRAREREQQLIADIGTNVFQAGFDALKSRLSR